MLNGKRVGAVIPAAGSGTRMGGVAKQFLEVLGKPLLAHVLDVIDRSPLVDHVAIAGPAESLSQIRALVAKYNFTKAQAVVAGGAHRQDSVWEGMCALRPASVELIVVHDAARPLITESLLREVLSSAEAKGAAIAAAPCSDTVKIADSTMVISQTVDRNIVWLAQTPQAFKTGLLEQAYEKARQESFYATDEAGLIEHYGHPVVVVPNTEENFKITTPNDLEYYRFLVKNRG